MVCCEPGAASACLAVFVHELLQAVLQYALILHIILHTLLHIAAFPVHENHGGVVSVYFMATLSCACGRSTVYRVRSLYVCISHWADPIHNWW